MQNAKSDFKSLPRRNALAPVRGFTLIELLIVMATMALLFSFGFANYRGFARRQMVQSAARQIKADIRLAQTQALSGVKPTGCVGLNGYNFDPDLINQSYEIIPNCISGSPGAIKTVSLPSDIAMNIDPICYAVPASEPFSCAVLGCGSSCQLVLFNVVGQGTNVPSGSNVTITVGLDSQLTGGGFCSFFRFLCSFAQAEPIDIVISSSGEIY
ncbi:MAG: Tfp pilus assembly protein FimT/FimU [Patescibacteria group bacterium]